MGNNQAQPTLRELAIAKFGTIKAFAIVWGQSASTVSGILRGTHHCTCTRDDIQRIADLFGISFEECVKVANFTFRTNYPEYPQDGYWDLGTRWAREAEWERKFFEWTSGGFQGKSPFNFSFDPSTHEALRMFGYSAFVV